MTENYLPIKKLKDYPDVLSVDDVCAILGVNSKTTYKLLKEGKIKSIRVGRLYKITKHNMTKFLKS